MNRRDFLLLRADRAARVLNLSCQQLYMRYLDARSSPEPAADASRVESNPWGAEPEPVQERRSMEDVLAAIERELIDIEVLRLTGSEWLAADGMRAAIEPLLAAFRARGGRIQLA